MQLSPLPAPAGVLRRPGGYHAAAPVAQGELRRHVHGVIDSLGLDIRHQTERRGSPYTLVCTKTRGAWQRRRAQYAEDIDHLRLLAASVPSSGSAADACAGDLQQVQAAISRNAAAPPAP